MIVVGRAEEKIIETAEAEGGTVGCFTAADVWTFGQNFGFELVMFW